MVSSSNWPLQSPANRTITSATDLPLPSVRMEMRVTQLLYSALAGSLSFVGLEAKTASRRSLRDSAA